MYEDRVVAGGGSRHVTAGLCEGSSARPCRFPKVSHVKFMMIHLVLIIKDRDLDFLV